MADELQMLQNVLMGIGLTNLPQLLMNLNKAQSATRNVKEGRSHKDDGPSAADKAQAALPGGVGPQGTGFDVQSALAPLLAQLGGSPGMPVNSPGVRPGLPPAPLPQAPSLPRTMQAGASPSGF